MINYLQFLERLKAIATEVDRDAIAHRLQEDVVSLVYFSLQYP